MYRKEYIEPMTLVCGSFEPMTPIHMRRVKALRNAKGLSQSDLAEIAKIGRQTLIRIEEGRSGGIDFGVLERLANALGVHPADLLTYDAPTRRRA